jgi:hypothetical protein
MDSYNNETFSTNIKNSINYIIENHHKFLLLLFVFFIIYFVDYITYINTILYNNGNSPPGLPILNNKIHQLPNVKNPKGKRNKSRRR